MKVREPGKRTNTRRLLIWCNGDRWVIAGGARSPGRLRIYECWLQEFEPVKVLVGTATATYATDLKTLREHGRRGQDALDMYVTLTKQNWERVG